MAVTPGISFVTRCRNDGEYLYKSLTSLSELNIPHEIIVNLHKCTDNSLEIANECARYQPIKINIIDTPISRAGYETLITPENHPFSLPTHYNKIFGEAQYNWKMKWDADFFARKELVDYFNNDHLLELEDPLIYRVGCNLDKSVTNREPYLFNCLTGYAKYMFWEVPLFLPDAAWSDLGDWIDSIPSQTVKEYWHEPAWFTEDSELGHKLKVLKEMIGPEPLGMARASNPECDIIFQKVINYAEALAHHGINIRS